MKTKTLKNGMIKMRNLTALVLGVVLLGMSSCSTLQVTTDYDKTADFTKYKSIEYYGWNEGTDKLMNEFDKNRIENAFANEFANRDLDIVEKGEGDLVVSLFLVLDQKTSKTAHTTHLGGAFGGYYGDYYSYGPGFGMGHSTTTFSEYEYTVGTLIVDVFDAETKKLVWQGIGTGTVDDNPQTREKHVDKAVAKVMENFPVTIKEVAAK